MEKFDILNRDGTRSGKVSNKGLDLKDGEYYMGAHVYIHNDQGEFLLQKRSRNKTLLPSAWDIHMGHVMAGETSKEAVIREIHEEIGYLAKDVTYYKRVTWDIHNHLIDIFVLEENIDVNTLTMKSEEVEELKYVSKEEMIKLVESMEYRPDTYRNHMIHYIKSLI